MSEAAFETLTNLKAAVLPPALASRTDWDVPIQAIGDGVAAAFAQHCNRLFAYDAAAVYETAGEKNFLSLPLYPIASITEIAMKYAFDAAYVAEAGVVANFHAESGIVEFATTLGDHLSLIRCTYAGGYQSFPTDLIAAWHTQVQHEIEQRDILRRLGAREGEEDAGFASLTLIPRVKEMLHPFIRYT